MNKVILAYSGGLYSSLVLHWLKNKRGFDVVAFSGKLNRQREVPNLEEKAMELGASEVVVVDLVEDFVQDYILPTLKANAKYESKYMFSTALSRPIILREMIKEAYNQDCDRIAHGCSPGSNDSIRLETIVASLTSEMEIVNPWSKWELNSFENIQRYAKRYGLDYEMIEEEDRIDENIWGRSIHPKQLLDSWNKPPEDIFTLTCNPEEAPDEVTELEINFKNGIPTHLDGKKTDCISIIEYLNELGGKNGIGRIDGLENVLSGRKSRELYEAPAATILYTAHQALEEITLSKDLLHFKAQASTRYAQLIYRGLWFSELREALDCFFAHAQTYVTGKVKLKIYKGNCSVLGCESPHSLFQKSPARGKISSQKFPPTGEFFQLPTLLEEPSAGEAFYLEDE